MTCLIGRRSWLDWLEQAKACCVVWVLVYGVSIWYLPATDQLVTQTNYWHQWADSIQTCHITCPSKGLDVLDICVGHCDISQR